MNKKFVMKVITRILTPTFAICLLAHILYVNLQKYDISPGIIQLSHGLEFTLGDMTDFSWDFAYLDYDKYTNAKPTIREHNLRGYVSGGLNVSMMRIIFTKNGWIVKSSILFSSDMKISFDESIDVLEPDTLLLAEEKVMLDIQWFGALDEEAQKGVLERIDEWTMLCLSVKE
jgi:hypothetical protein